MRRIATWRIGWMGAAACVLLGAGCRSEIVVTRIDAATIDLGPPPAPVPATTQQPSTLPPPPTVVRLGTSVRGVPLEMVLFGSGPERVLIFGGIHGNEPTSAELAWRLVEYLTEHSEWVEGRAIAVLPATNPDGLARRRRNNANNVDLNRNFPAVNWYADDGASHGPRPASEPETRAIMHAVALLRPDRILSIHSIARGRHCNNYDGPAADLAQRMGRYNRYPVQPTMGYPTPGSFGSWAGRDQRIPTITLELPRDLHADACWQENRAALLAFIQGTHAGP